jgi:hypothetical protein
LVVVVQEIVVDQQVNLHQFMHTVEELEELEFTVRVKPVLPVDLVVEVDGVIVRPVQVVEVMVVEIQEDLEVGQVNLEVVRHTVLQVVVVQVVPAVITVVVMVAQVFLVL